MQAFIERKRQVDAPEVSQAVLIQGLKHNAARDAVRDASLDHDRGPGMHGHAPDGTAERAVSVGIPAIAVPAEAPALGLKNGPDVDHHIMKPLVGRARPRRAQQSVQVLIPVFVDQELRTLSVPLVPLPHLSGQSPADYHRISGKCARQARELLQARPVPRHLHKSPRVRAVIRQRQIRPGSRLLAGWRHRRPSITRAGWALV